MSFEHKEGSGSIFKNQKTKQTQPDMTGDAKIDGKIYRISAWWKDGKRGEFLSLSVQLPRPVGGSVPTGGRYDPRNDPDDSEVPW